MRQDDRATLTFSETTWDNLFDMLRRLTIAVSNGLAVGLLVIGVGRIVAYVHPGGTVWSAVAVIAGIAAVLGFGLAERARSDDPQLGARRLGSVQLLAGVAVVLVLGGLYLLPVFRSVAVAQWADIVGPVCALLFFPMLLISTGVRLSLTTGQGSMLLSVLTIAGVVGGWALVCSSEALFTPGLGHCRVGHFTHAAGLTSLSVHLSKSSGGGRWVPWRVLPQLRPRFLRWS